MTALTLNNVGDLNNTTSSASTINANSAAIVAAMTSSVAKAGDKMSGILDMNSNQIINLPAPSTADSPIRLIDFSVTSATPSVLSGSNVYTGNNTFSGTTNFSTVSVTSSITTASLSTGSANVSGALSASSFVTNSVSTASLTGCFGSFRADFGGTSFTYTTISPNAYQLLQWKNVENNLGGSYFTSGGPSSQSFVFYPPTGTKVVYLDANIFVTGGVVSGSNCTVKWVKNATWSGSGFQVVASGGDIAAGVAGFCIPTTSFFGIARASAWDAPSSGDYYQVGVFCDGATTGSGITVDGNIAHTYVSGFYLQ